LQKLFVADSITTSVSVAISRIILELSLSMILDVKLSKLTFDAPH